jgi:hypothetical protein
VPLAVEIAKGRDAVEKEIKRFVNNVERFEILETWAPYHGHQPED